ncbi:MAG: DHH family phosphoesterase [Oscillospiraceae bacterium]|nr:DHH family phosphoesterase [Oscillospiraceae bacterium]
MNIKKKMTAEISLCILLLCFAILATLTAFLNIYLFFAALTLSLVAALLLFIRSASIRAVLSKIIGEGFGSVNTENKSSYKTMNIPILITDSSRNVLWYNDSFKQKIVGVDTENIFLEDICMTIENFNVVSSMSPGGVEYEIKQRNYTVFTAASVSNSETLYISYFIDDTEKTRNSIEFLKTRPSILLLLLDNLDEIESDMKASDSAIILADVNRVLENFINQTNGILTRISTKQYIAIIEEQHIEKIIDDRFKVLDNIRSVTTGALPITLSIGVGRGANTIYENHILARQALDMALGRGGDQAALKTRSGYVFYGGTSREIEKRNRIRSRVIATSLLELFKDHTTILIMGHKITDLDSLGSAIGLLRIAKIAGVPGYIVYDSKTSLSTLMYEQYIKESNDRVRFISPHVAHEYIDTKTLVVVVDCHTYNMLDKPELLESAASIVVIDHHRRMVGYIEDTVLFYHEPYASSCSEMISELLEHLESSENKPTKMEAETMLAGIMLDSKDFSVRTGVRTFDAASYLRNLGADTVVAKSFFAISMNEYLYKAGLVSNAVEYKGCAITITDFLPEHMRVVVPQTADDLLNIEGIKASIVAVKTNGTYFISARSYGTYNVQLIMEKMGGGGHQTTAGAQIEDVDDDTIKSMIYYAIDKYIEENVR